MSDGVAAFRVSSRSVPDVGACPRSSLLLVSIHWIVAVVYERLPSRAMSGTPDAASAVNLKLLASTAVSSAVRL